MGNKAVWTCGQIEHEPVLGYSDRRCFTAAAVATVALVAILSVFCATCCLIPAPAHASGWVKESGTHHYYSAGKLQKNKIVGSKKAGFYYVDKGGARITSKPVKRAVKLVRKITKASWSKARKLEACYSYIVKQCSYKRAYDKVSKKKLPSYASYLFKHRQGNCYRGASALAYCARVIGYDSGLVAGLVSSHSPIPISRHGITRVKQGGLWRWYDTSMARRHGMAKLGGVLPSKYPFAFKAQHTWTLKSGNGKVRWK